VSVCVVRPLFDDGSSRRDATTQTPSSLKGNGSLVFLQRLQESIRRGECPIRRPDWVDSALFNDAVVFLIAFLDTERKLADLVGP
jgi:hypothetical protein